jgi:hypothetical protein
MKLFLMSSLKGSDTVQFRHHFALLLPTLLLFGVDMPAAVKNSVSPCMHFKALHTAHGVHISHLLGGISPGQKE